MAENATAETDTASDEEATPIEVYEWGGGVVACLGLLFTPAVTALPALYCALKINDEKPLASLAIGILVMATAVFWFSVLFFV